MRLFYKIYFDKINLSETTGPVDKVDKFTEILTGLRVKGNLTNHFDWILIFFFGFDWLKSAINWNQQLKLLFIIISWNHKFLESSIVEHSNSILLFNDVKNYYF